LAQDQGEISSTSCAFHGAALIEMTLNIRMDGLTPDQVSFRSPDHVWHKTPVLLWTLLANSDDLKRRGEKSRLHLSKTIRLKVPVKEISPIPCAFQPLRLSK
jgi:hypothetical protein